MDALIAMQVQISGGIACLIRLGAKSRTFTVDAVWLN